jgi:AraC-like DNA-binding protein
VLGVCTRATEVPLVEGARYWSIRFRPETGACWMGASASSLRDRNIDARELLGEDVMRVGSAIAHCEQSNDVVRLLDDYVSSRARFVDQDTIVRAGVGAIVQEDGKASIVAVARDVGTSVRTLQRRFVKAVGLTPKEFASIRRGRGALKRVVFGGGPESDGWSGLAMDAGFADQAHMTREFNRLTRFAPRALHARLETIDHGQIVD